jgi:DNA-binding NtrC family response regulator
MDKHNQRFVLLVENDLATRELYQRELAKEYTVEAIAPENSIIEKIDYNKMAAIIIGLDTPLRDGRVVLEKITQKTSGLLIPIIVYSTSEERRREIQELISEFLLQPVLPPVLLRRVMQYTERQGTSSPLAPFRK